MSILTVINCVLLVSMTLPVYGQTITALESLEEATEKALHSPHSISEIEPSDYNTIMNYLAITDSKGRSNGQMISQLLTAQESTVDYDITQYSDIDFQEDPIWQDMTWKKSKNGKYHISELHWEFMDGDLPKDFQFQGKLDFTGLKSIEKITIKPLSLDYLSVYKTFDIVINNNSLIEVYITYSISSIVFLEASNLRYLYCMCNSIKSLDLSNCNSLLGIDVSHCDNLTEIIFPAKQNNKIKIADCSNTGLKKLDTSTCYDIELIFCSDCSNLAKIIVPKTSHKIGFYLFVPSVWGVTPTENEKINGMSLLDETTYFDSHRFNVLSPDYMPINIEIPDTKRKLVIEYGE